MKPQNLSEIIQYNLNSLLLPHKSYENIVCDMTGLEEILKPTLKPVSIITDPLYLGEEELNY